MILVTQGFIMKKWFFLFVFSISFINISVHTNIYPETKRKIAVFTMRNKEDMFFSLVVQFMEAACKNLDMELSSYYGNNDHLYLVEKIKEVTEKNKFDAIVILN